MTTERARDIAGSFVRALHALETPRKLDLLELVDEVWDEEEGRLPDAIARMAEILETCPEPEGEVTT